jgi:dipeptidyl aminopeptidase/acylaminoacyl peptidase
MITVRVFLALALLAPAPLVAQARRPMTFDDFAALKAVADPQLSPDGRTLLYSVRTTDVEANRRSGTTYALTLGGASVTPRAFPDDTTHAAEARWSPDGRRIAYTAGGQLWVANADGSGRRQLTTLNGGASGPVWAPNGSQVAFVSAVWPDCTTDACNAGKDKAKAETKVKAHVADNLMFRHWNAWDEGTRSHLFVVGVDGDAPRDLTAGARYDVPPGPFGGSEGYTFSPDSRELAYTAKDDGRQRVRRPADRWRAYGHHTREHRRGPEPGLLARRQVHRVRVDAAWRLRVGPRQAHAVRSRREDVHRGAAALGPERGRLLVLTGRTRRLRRDDRQGTRQAVPRRALA